MKPLRERHREDPLPHPRYHRIRQPVIRETPLSETCNSLMRIAIEYRRHGLNPTIIAAWPAPRVQTNPVI